MIRIKQSGNFNFLERFLKRAPSIDYHRILSKYGQEGVAALASVTPIDSGDTKNSWSYEVVVSPGYSRLTWKNSNVTSSGVPVAILIQYGHATGNGGYVEGRDFINPAILPIFQRLADELWREVSNL